VSRSPTRTGWLAPALIALLAAPVFAQDAEEPPAEAPESEAPADEAPAPQETPPPEPPPPAPATPEPPALSLPPDLPALVAAPSDQALAAELARGTRIYNSKCATCHGADGTGDGPSARYLAPAPRDFTSGLFKFRSTPSGAPPSDDDLARTVRQGVPGTSMPPFARELSDADVAAVVATVKSFSDRFDGDPVEPLVFAEDLDFSDAAAARGAPLFGALCGSCHGPEGRGDGPAAGGMVDLWGDPIAPTDLTLGLFKAGNDSPYDLLRTITTGIEGTAMVPWAGLPEQQRAELAAYVLSLGQGSSWFTSWDAGRYPARDGLSD